MLKWQKANYGGTDQKSGGGKLDVPGTKGSMGIPPGSSVPKSSVSRGSKNIDSPGEKGNRGVDVNRGFPNKKAPLSE